MIKFAAPLQGCNSAAVSMNCFILLSSERHSLMFLQHKCKMLLRTISVTSCTRNTFCASVSDKSDFLCKQGVIENSGEKDPPIDSVHRVHDQQIPLTCVANSSLSSFHKCRRNKYVVRPLTFSSHQKWLCLPEFQRDDVLMPSSLLNANQNRDFSTVSTENCSSARVNPKASHISSLMSHWVPCTGLSSTCFYPPHALSSTILIQHCRRYSMKRKDYTKFPEIKEEDIEEMFVRGSGPGGQAVNQTANCVVLKHKPSGIVIKCHETRSLEENRKRARIRLEEKLDLDMHGDESYLGQLRAEVKDSKQERKRRANKRLALKKTFKEREGLE